MTLGTLNQPTKRACCQRTSVQSSSGVKCQAAPDSDVSTSISIPDALRLPTTLLLDISNIHNVGNLQNWSWGPNCGLIWARGGIQEFGISKISTLQRPKQGCLIVLAHRPYRISHIIYSQGRADNGDPCWVRRILAKLPGCCFITCRTGCCSCSDHRSLCLCKLATERLPTWSAHETLLREPSSDPRFQVFHSVYAESWLPQVGSEAIC